MGGFVTKFAFPDNKCHASTEYRANNVPVGIFNYITGSGMIKNSCKKCGNSK